MADQGAVHRVLDAVSLRAHATAVGLVQLTLELRRVGVIDEGAVDRIKDAMVEEICSTRPRNTFKSAFEADIRARLNRVFAGEQPLGSAPSHDEG